MSIRPFRDIKRRKTKKIKVGKVEVGGDALISVQSMTKTLKDKDLEKVNKSIINTVENKTGAKIRS